MTICKVLSKTKTTQKPSYEDFEPYLKWYHEVDHEQSISISVVRTFTLHACFTYIYFLLRKLKFKEDMLK